MNAFVRSPLLLVLVLLFACSDDDASLDAATDASSDVANADVISDAVVADSASDVIGEDVRSGSDSGNVDSGIDAGTGEVIVLSEQMAFPSVEGAGSVTTGGRGGRVIHVRNLNDDGPGSFREAMNAEGPRTIVFDVSGRIQLLSRIELIRADSDLTIAGETAPEGGITIAGKPLRFGGGYNRAPEPMDNVIIRHLRIRNGSYTGEPDVGDHNGILGTGTDKFVFDHMSFSFNDDQAIAMGSNYGPMRDGTIQRCTFSENATAIIMGFHASEFPTERISFLKNLFVHQSHRTPNLGREGRIDVINNVLFNWGSRLVNLNGGSPELNYVGNHLTPGDSSSSANKIQTTSAADPVVYTALNFHPALYPVPVLDDRGLWSEFSSMDALPARYFTTTQYPLLATTVVESAADARAEVLADFGTNAFVSDTGETGRYQDSYDVERHSDVINGVSRDPANKDWVQPVLPNNTRPESYYGALADIPAWFAEAHGISANADVVPVYDFGEYQVHNDAGYSAFEVYLFYAAGDFDRLR